MGLVGEERGTHGMCQKRLEQRAPGRHRACPMVAGILIVARSQAGSAHMPSEPVWATRRQHHTYREKRPLSSC